MGNDGLKPSFHHPPILVWGIALLIAVSGLLLSTSGAQAAHRGAVLVKDIKPGRSGSSSGYMGGCYSCYAYGGPLVGAGGLLYLSVDDGRHGFELWRSDGTGKGTRMVKDINPGKEWSSLYPLAVVGRTFYFGASDGVHGFELWRSDGTGKGTTMVKDMNPGPGDGGPGWSTAFGGSLYFAAWDGTEGGRGLWRTDGTAAGTSLVKHLSGGIMDLAAAGGALYFSVANGYSELWRSDGTTAGTSLVKGGFHNSLEELTDFNGAVYFRADDGINKPALWRSDGTEVGTTMVKRVNSANPYMPCCFTIAGGSLYFLSSDTDLAPNELWRSDGTEAGTTLVKQIGGGAFIVDPVVFRKTNLYFLTQGALWRSDGTARGTKIVKKVDQPVSLTAAKKTLYFVATDGKHGEELWRSDGTKKGTKVARDIRRGAPSSHPQDLLAVGGTLFFTAKEGNHGRELWRAGPPLCAKGKCKKA